MTTKILIVANWKASSAKFEIRNLKFEINDEVEVAVAAPFTMISEIPEQFTRAAQNVSAYPTGAYTGEIPAKMLADLGVKYVLIGHSERRKYLHETNKEVEEKMQQAIQNNIVPIICAQSLEEIPENIRNFSAEKYVIMYEPFSAISTDGVYHAEEPEKVAATVAQWKNKLNLKCRFLYGGSVNEENVNKYLTENLVSGFVVGHASLEWESFFAIIKRCHENLNSQIF